MLKDELVEEIRKARQEQAARWLLRSIRIEPRCYDELLPLPLDLPSPLLHQLQRRGFPQGEGLLPDAIELKVIGQMVPKLLGDTRGARGGVV